jgi:DNA/RNA-binding domain of Phe-tRNA-synthetase-like protein
MPIIFNRIPRKDVFLGAVVADQIEAEVYPPAFDQELRSLLKERGQELTPDEEELRGRVRDILRNGSYKPTGRGKPASEYLVRRAREADGAEVPQDAFPRINAPVDCCNYISLRYLLPISMWDLDRAGVDSFVFRLGRPGESYVFNDAGQAIDVEDLIIGCRSRTGDDDGEPIVNPVKDSMTTKSVPDSRRVASVIYAPSDAAMNGRLQEACEAYAALLAGCGSAVSARYAVIPPGGQIDI